MRLSIRNIIILMTATLFMALPTDSIAQNRKQKRNATEAQIDSREKITPGTKSLNPGSQPVSKSLQEEGLMKYIVEGNDTIYIDEIRASKVYSRVPKQKGKEWRKYYRLVHNFSKTLNTRYTSAELLAEINDCSD
mgnify:CR=1 FL=1